MRRCFPSSSRTRPRRRTWPRPRWDCSTTKPAAARSGKNSRPLLPCSAARERRDARRKRWSLFSTLGDVPTRCSGTCGAGHMVYSTPDLKKAPRSEIPRKAVYRLSLYLRCLHRLKQNAIRTVSSEALAKAAGVKSTQLRKDLTYFGQFGTRGLGYDVEHLSQTITDTLGTNSLQPVILVGVGNLGSALLSYRGFEQEGFEIVAAFDLDAARVRAKQPVKPVHGMEKLCEFVHDHRVKMAVFPVPAAILTR